MRLVPPNLICSSKKNQIHSNRCGTLTGFSNEVISVIRGYPGLQKISFLSHSLGGLVSRYAIAKLYEESSQENGEHRSDESKDPFPEDKFKGQIVGLEPMNFITSATPHLGSRGHKQITASLHYPPVALIRPNGKV